MKITLIKDMTGKELIREFEDTYGSMERLKRILNKDPENMKLYTDMDEWKYFLEHPDENVQKKHIKFTDDINLGKLELKLLNMIKSENPKSIRDLALKAEKDPSNVQNKINHLAEEGLISFEKGLKNSKKPVLNYDIIEIAI
jgi:predicted MarR family transcription regulator